MYKVILSFVMLIAFGIGNISLAQKVKQLESSSKKKPEWVSSVAKDFVITVASSSTLEDAQQKALTKVKEQIISSVAENIQTSSEYFRNESIKNDNTDFTESFTTATKTHAADIPFVKGISISKVSDFYWEKVKKGDEIKIYYHLKYPFTQQQLKELVVEYEKADQAKTDELEALLNQIPNMESCEKMSQTIKELEALAVGFIKVDPRKDKANAGIAKLKDILKNISIETINNTLGEVRIALRVGGKTVITSRKPTVRSNCAKITDVRSKGSEWTISYSYDECYEDPDNAIKVSFRNAYGKTSSDFYFNVDADKIDVFVNNDINFTGENICHISLTSKYESAFIIEKVILNFGNEAPMIIDNINKQFQGEGNHDLDLTVIQEFDKAMYNAKNYPMIKGAIHYKSVKTGEQSIYKMFNQNITSSW